MHLARTRPDACTWGERAAFDRLDPDSSAPIAVAVSGGGDSLAALIHTCAWAGRVRRPVVALSVDHQLQADSAAWTAFVGEAAAALGARFRALAWTDDKPATGLPAAARLARHRLLADAARAAGCTVIVTGHTADDQLENAALGQGVLHAWSPSPVWPQGRGLFLLRPLLGDRRADIRSDLAGDGWPWIDDPANLDPKSARARLRAAAGGSNQGERGAEPSLFGREGGSPPIPVPSPIEGEGGELRFDRSQLTGRTVATAAVCAGGGERPPRTAEVDRLMARIAAGGDFTATLAGARIEVAASVLFTRELGRRGLAGMELPQGCAVVWDGRFEITAKAPGLTVRALAGSMARLKAEPRAALRRIAAAARPASPLIENKDGVVFCPMLARDNAVRIVPLVTRRFMSACDAIRDERQACDVLCMAK